MESTYSATVCFIVGGGQGVDGKVAISWEHDGQGWVPYLERWLDGGQVPIYRWQCVDVDGFSDNDDDTIIIITKTLDALDTFLRGVCSLPGVRTISRDRSSVLFNLFCKTLMETW